MLAEGDLAVVSVEEGVLYEHAFSDHLFLKVAVTSSVSEPIGLQVRDYWSLVSPMYYMWSSEQESFLLDYLSRVPPAVTDSMVRECSAMFEEGLLKVIPPGGEAVYFADFNGASAEEMLEGRDSWLLFSMSGWVVVTNGDEVEVIEAPGGLLDVSFPAPLSIEAIPAGSIVAQNGAEGPMVGILKPWGLMPQPGASPR